MLLWVFTIMLINFCLFASFMAYREDRRDARKNELERLSEWYEDTYLQDVPPPHDRSLR